MTGNVTEKLQARARRFNIINTEGSSSDRLSRFSNRQPIEASKDKAKLNERAKRFAAQNTVISKAESDKRKERLARFAESTQSGDKMARRAERFSQ